MTGPDDFAGQQSQHPPRDLLQRWLVAVGSGVAGGLIGGGLVLLAKWLIR